MKKEKSKSLSSYIKIYDNIFTKKECDFILNEYINSDEWEDTCVGSDKNGKSIYDMNKCNCQLIPISEQLTLSKNLEKRIEIDNFVFSKVSIVIQKYMSDFPKCILKTDTGYNLMRYQLGGYYKQHCDNLETHPRTISASFIINDDYDGGNLCFFDKSIKVKQKLGSVIVFPSNFMYPHEVTPVTEGVRYSLVTWFN